MLNVHHKLHIKVHFSDLYLHSGNKLCSGMSWTIQRDIMTAGRDRSSQFWRGRSHEWSPHDTLVITLKWQGNKHRPGTCPSTSQTGVLTGTKSVLLQSLCSPQIPNAQVREITPLKAFYPSVGEIRVGWLFLVVIKRKHRDWSWRRRWKAGPCVFWWPVDLGCWAKLSSMWCIMKGENWRERSGSSFLPRMQILRESPWVITILLCYTYDYTSCVFFCHVLQKSPITLRESESSSGMRRTLVWL